MTAVQNPQDPTAEPQPTNQHLRAAVQIVREARARLADAKAIWDLMQATFQANNSDRFVELSVAKAATETAESQLRELAEAHYNTTREKHPVPGVEIKLVTEVTIIDPKAALAYAKQSGLCLVLDDKSYRSLAKTNEVPGTIVKEVPKASIAKDLTAAVRESVQ